jgi:hypothetical protein
MESGLPTTTPTESSSVTSDLSVLRAPWTATFEGDITGLYFWVGDFDITGAWVVVYKENVDGLSTTIMAKARVLDVVALNGWNYQAITSPEPGQSLTVFVGDKISHGIVVDPATGFTYGADTSGGDGILTSNIDVSGGPPSQFNYSSQMTATADYDAAFTLIFDPASVVSMESLTGTWQSPTHDLGAVVKVRVWGDFIADFDSAGESWGDNFSGDLAWSDLWIGSGATAMRWRDIFAMTRSGKIQATLLAQDTDSDWDTNATRYDFFEMQSVEIENRYVRVEVTITDPSADSHVYLKKPSLYAYTGPVEIS